MARKGGIEEVLVKTGQSSTPRDAGDVYVKNERYKCFIWITKHLNTEKRVEKGVILTKFEVFWIANETMTRVFDRFFSIETKTIEY